jgi:hypothetical protein
VQEVEINGHQQPVTDGRVKLANSGEAFDVIVKLAS